jgi:hypothetical protein
MPVAKRNPAFSRRAVVHSGDFFIVNGAFVTPTEKGE